MSTVGAWQRTAIGDDGTFSKSRQTYIPKVDAWIAAQ